MRHLFFAILLVLFFAVSCDDAVRVVPEADGEGGENQSEKGGSEEISDSDEAGISDENPEKPQKDDENYENNDEDNEKPDGNSGSEPVDDGDTAQEEGGSDSEQQNDEEGENGNQNDSEELNDEDEEVLHEKRTVACRDLPENAEWNTASVITQTWENGGYTPSETGTYSKEPAPSTTVVTYPEATEPLPQQCPEGTSKHNGVCQIDNCGTFTFKNILSHSTLCGESSKGQKMCLKDKTLCYKTEEDANSQKNQVPCCCDSEIYDVRWGNSLIPPLYEATELVNGTAVKTSEIFSCQKPVPCEDGFEYGEKTGKCYECLGELSFDDGKYQCSTEIGTECRFKCRKTFEWNKNESICQSLE